MQLAFENQLFRYIHYSSEINVNLLLNIFNFHGKFRFIFSSILSEYGPNVHFREARFQNSPGRNSPVVLILLLSNQLRTASARPVSLESPLIPRCIAGIVLWYECKEGNCFMHHANEKRIRFNVRVKVRVRLRFGLSSNNFQHYFCWLMVRVRVSVLSMHFNNGPSKN